MTKLDQIRAAESKLLLQTYERNPILFVGGQGVHIVDENGTKYLDLLSGIGVNALGYGHPAILGAIERQSRKLVHISNLYFHEGQAELALRVLGRWDKIREQIARLADTYLEVFRDTAVETFLPPGCDHGGLMRFPVALPGKDQERVLQLGRKRGLYLKVIWDRPLPAESEYSRFPNAVWTARNLVLLPLYRALSAESAAQLARNVVEIERNEA